MKKSLLLLSMILLISSAKIYASPGYCTPTVTAHDDGNKYTFFSYFAFGDLSNFPGLEGYADYSADYFTNAIAGSSMDIILYPINEHTGNVKLNLFIDFNGDLDFDDDGEWVIVNEEAVSNDFFFTPINIPINVTNGESKMRVSISREDISSSCGDFGIGQVHDYGIIFSGGAGYCIPTGIGNTDGHTLSINMVVIDGQIFSPDASTDAYQDLTSIVTPNFLAGQFSIDFYASVTDDVSDGFLKMNIFIDLNRDGDFDDENEWPYVNSGFTEDIGFLGQIFMPQNLSSREPMRMRCVISAPADLISSCGNLGRCNIQDYTINIIGDSWFADTDEDGFGNPQDSLINGVSQPSGYVADNTDCDDNDGDVYPGAVPTDISVDEISSSTALVSWTEGCATQWRTRKSKLGENNWQYAVINSTSRKLVGMEPGTDYEVQVRAYGSDSSDWSASQNFTTLSTCNNVSGLSASNIKTTSARLNWTNETTASKRFHYRTVGSNTWTVVQAGPNAVKHSLTGLTPNTDYEWQVRVVCSPGGADLTAWSAMQNFTTASVTRMEDNMDDENAVVTIYPNPGKGVFNMSAEFSTDETIDLVVTDILGKEILREKKIMVEGENNFSLDLRANAPGIYLLKIFSAEGAVMHKMVKE